MQLFLIVFNQIPGQRILRLSEFFRPVLLPFGRLFELCRLIEHDLRERDIDLMFIDYSYSWADIGIEYGESLERVEAVLEKEFPNIKKHLPNIIDGPFYKGVDLELPFKDDKEPCKDI